MDENANVNWVIAGVGLLIIIVGGWWVISHNASGAGTMATSTATTTMTDNTSTSGSDTNSQSAGSETTTGSSATPEPTAAASGDTVSVADQPAGTSVAVASVTLSKDGWVAIRDDKGWTLGAAWFPAGTQHTVSVQLLRATEAGKRYQALLFIDTAGDHTFDVHGETLVTNSDGSIAGAMFTAGSADAMSPTTSTGQAAAPSGTVDQLTAPMAPVAVPPVTIPSSGATSSQ